MFECADAAAATTRTLPPSRLIWRDSELATLTHPCQPFESGVPTLGMVAVAVAEHLATDDGGPATDVLTDGAATATPALGSTGVDAPVWRPDGITAWTEPARPSTGPGDWTAATMRHARPGATVEGRSRPAYLERDVHAPARRPTRRPRPSLVRRTLRRVRGAALLVVLLLGLGTVLAVALAGAAAMVAIGVRAAVGS